MVSCGIISLKKYRLATNMKLVITFWMPCAAREQGLAASDKRRDELRERRKKSQAERKEEAAKGEDHEPPSRKTANVSRERVNWSSRENT